MTQADLIAELEQYDCSKMRPFSFHAVDTFARVVKIYDPDTLTVIFKYNEKMVKVSVRLEGIDAPEKKSRIKSECEACYKGVAFLNSLILDKVVRIKLGKFDKYGRALCYLYQIDSDQSINDMLIQYQYVRSYDGGKKPAWSEEELKVAGTKCAEATAMLGSIGL